MKKNRIFFSKYFYRFFLLLFSLLNACTFIIPENDYDSIDRLMESAISDFVFPGAVLLFGNENKILFNKAYGNFTYDKNSDPVIINTIFDLASLTKVIGTTSAALLLVQSGKLNLDDKVVKYLPEFNNHAKSEITIRNLLLHNSGLPAFKKYYDIYNSSDEVISDIMNLNLEFSPGDIFVYSDLGMITLQKVIEHITDQSLDLFLRENLFNKLEMNNTMYNPPDKFKSRCAPTEIDDFWRMRLIQGEVHDERAFMLNGVAGHAGLFSTSSDLSNFLMMILNNGIFGNEKIFDPLLLNLWTSKQSDQSSRGLGWDTKSPSGYSSAGKLFSNNSFGHTGFTGTSIWVDKENKFFVILLSNRVYPTRNNKKIIKFRPNLHDAIFQKVFGK